MEFPIELIPSQENVARLIFHPACYDAEGKFQWSKGLKFPDDISKGESVCWERYAPDDFTKHNFGVQVGDQIRTRNPLALYKGFKVALVQEVRKTKNSRGHSFDVIHKPCGGEGLHHAELVFLPNPLFSIKPSDRAELKLALEAAFSELISFIS